MWNVSLWHTAIQAFHYTRHGPPEIRAGHKQLVTFKALESSLAGRTGASRAVPGDKRVTQDMGQKPHCWSPCCTSASRGFFHGGCNQTQGVNSSSHRKQLGASRLRAAEVVNVILILERLRQGSGEIAASPQDFGPVL